MANTRGAGESSRYGRNDEFRDNDAYGRGSSFEGGAGQDYGSRQDFRSQNMRPYGSSYSTGRRIETRHYDHDDDSWSTPGFETIPAFAIGAGLGFLAGWLLTGQSSQNSHRGWQENDYGSNRSSQFTQGEGLGSAEIEETTDLIGSNKVDGTAVYDRDGTKLGTVYNFMVGKRSGKVAYAVLSFGGMLGIGGSYYPLPWNTLTYDTSKGGYVLGIDKDRIGSAPSYRAGEDPFSNTGYGRQVTDYWSSGATGF
jgi:hypothetical protein